MIIKITVDWLHGYGNTPEIVVYTDSSMPSTDAFRYTKKRSGQHYIYRAINDEGFASFFAYSGPGTGYGGSKFELTMTDGSVDTLIGPWSSNASAVNSAYDELPGDKDYVTEIVLITPEGHRYAAAMRLKAIINWLKEYPQDFGLALAETFGYIGIQPYDKKSGFKHASTTNLATLA